MIDMEMNKLRSKAETLEKLSKLLMACSTLEGCEEYISFETFNEYLDSCKIKKEE